MRALGVDLGGTKLLTCLVEQDGRIVGRTIRPTGRATGPTEACRIILDAASELREAFGLFDAVGIGFPGVVDFRRGLVRSSVMLDGWRDVPLAQWLAPALGVPCTVDNDVNAAAVAELRERDAETPDSMLFVAVGTGIGGAITLGNRLWRGHTGVAGEIGNVTIDRHGRMCWCGRRGCLNTSASGAAIERELDSALSLAELVERGDPRLNPVLDEAARALGIGLANAMNLLNPGLLVLGGGVAQLGTAWLETVARTARAEAFEEAGQCRFELARAGYDAGAVGAALLGIGALMERSATTTDAPADRAAAEVPSARRPSEAPHAAR
jgi:glucokinase